VTLLAAMLGFLFAAIGPADAVVTVIVGATLVDGGGRAPLADSIVVVRGGQIAAVGDRKHTPIPKGATLVEGRRLWIAPAPAAAAPGPALVPAIAALVRGPVARVVAGQPAHLALLDADPRRGDGAPARVRRLWISGISAEAAAEKAR
jgi:hypothetical protein